MGDLVATGITLGGPTEADKLRHLLDMARIERDEVAKRHADAENEIYRLQGVIGAQGAQVSALLSQNARLQLELDRRVVPSAAPVTTTQGLPANALAWAPRPVR